ncbi:MAG: leucine-rich repeat domain-containing protein [Holosporales bacterium]|nr:leucine-rich repeat domain-containing protein [Holosporales bacterium]
MQANKRNVTSKLRSNVLKTIRQILFLSALAGVTANANENYTYDEIDAIYKMIGDQSIACINWEEDWRDRINILIRNVIYAKGVMTVTVTINTGRTAEEIERYDEQVRNPWGLPHLPINIQRCCIARNVERIEESTFENYIVSDGLAFEAGSHLCFIGKHCFSSTCMLNICIPKNVTQSATTIMDAAFEQADISLIILNCNINALPPRLFYDVISYEIIIFSCIDTIGNECFRWEGFGAFGGNNRHQFDATRIINQHQIAHIGPHALVNNKISKYTGSSDLRKIDTYAFEFSNLIDVDLSRSRNVKFGYGVFNGCENLSSIVLPPNIMSIPKCICSNCRNLTSIFFPDSVTSLKEYCFAQSGLREIDLPHSLLSIRKEALVDTCIKHLTIPASVLHMGDNAVYGIPKLTFERSAQSRYFSADTLSNLERIGRFGPNEMENAFVVTEIPLSYFVNEAGVEDFANTLDETTMPNYSVLVRWSPNRGGVSVNGLTKSLRSWLNYAWYHDTCFYKKYVCVPGSDDDGLFQHLTDGRLYVRPAGSLPVKQIVEDQHQQALVELKAEALVESLAEEALVQLAEILAQEEDVLEEEDMLGSP